VDKIDSFLLALSEDWRIVAALAVLGLLVALAFLYRQYARILFKNLARNPLRTFLTSGATVLFVFVVTLVWSVLWLLDLVTTEKSKDFKAMVTERWQLPSRMPFAYSGTLAEGAARKPGDVRPLDNMTWEFFGGSLEKETARRTRENMLFFFCMDPAKVLSMMDGMDELSPDETARCQEMIRLVQEDNRRIVLGFNQAKATNKKVGERITLYSMNLADIVMEDCEIVGILPDGRWNQIGVMHRDRLHRAMDAYKDAHHGTPHPLADKTLGVVSLKVTDTGMYNQLAKQITDSPLYSSPAVKVETWSGGVAAFLDAYRDLLWWVRWVLVPVLLVTMALVIANAISISVRERRTEMAVLKVLGFGPTTILLLVLSEAVLIGCLSGLISVSATWLVVNKVYGGVKFPIGFFPEFRIPVAAFYWGPLLGGLTALAGSLTPAWAARSVKVSEVFAKVS
jgi:putative ABC transport system permease protein